MTLIWLLLFFIGYLIRIASVRRIGVISWRIYPPPKIIKDGIYSKIRHPMYAGSLLMAFGMFGLLAGIKIAICLMFVISNFILDRIDREEQMMLSIFGDNYGEYMKQTKMFIPYIF